MHDEENNFIVVDSLSAPRFRRMAEIISHIPSVEERNELVFLIFAEVNETMKQQLEIAYRRRR